jgi:hypothetical protein
MHKVPTQKHSGTSECSLVGLKLVEVRLDGILTEIHQRWLMIERSNRILRSIEHDQQKEV